MLTQQLAESPVLPQPNIRKGHAVVIIAILICPNMRCLVPSLVAMTVFQSRTYPRITVANAPYDNISRSQPTFQGERVRIHKECIRSRRVQQLRRVKEGSLRFAIRRRQHLLGFETLNPTVA